MTVLILRISASSFKLLVVAVGLKENYATLPFILNEVLVVFAVCYEKKKKQVLGKRLSLRM